MQNGKNACRQRARLELVCWELRKLYRMPMLHVFLLLCIGFNMQLVLGDRYGEDYVAYVKQAASLAGDRMGQAFSERVEKLADSREKERLLCETKNTADIFEDYDAMDTAFLLVGRYRVDGWVAKALEKKYQKQQGRIQELAAAGISMEVGAAGMTKPLFDALFGRLCRAVLTQGLLIAVFAALYISGSERAGRTWMMVYATRRGRSVQQEKFLAGFFYALAAYGTLALVSCAFFAASWRLGDIWKTHMSTQFYFVYSMGARLPFVSWSDFTMCSYLVAVLLMGIVVAAVFYLFGYLAGLLAKNSYVGFAALLLIGALNFEIVLLAGNAGRWGIYEAAMWTPVIFWWSHPLWFTDMGIQAVIPWQECAVGAFCIVQAAVLLTVGFRYYNRKDFR